MSPVLRLSLLAATTLVLFSVAGAMVVALAYPRVRAQLALRPPDLRARLVMGWAALPGLASFVLLSLCFVPSLWSLLGLADDHCPLHDDGHLHLCLAHSPQHPVSLAEWGLVLAGALAVGAVVFRLVRNQAATRRAIQALLRHAGPDVRSGGLVSTAEPLSVTTGLLSPLVLVSTGLRRHLDPLHVEAVLAHERAHARRRDPLRLLAVAVLGALHGPATRRLLFADVALACEEAADEDAARALGDRTLVAEAIVAVERLLGGHARSSGFAPGMAGCATEVRVQALLGEPLPARPPGRARRLLWSALAAAALAGAHEIHHLTETVLDLIAR